MTDLLNVLLLEDSRTDARLIQSCLKTSQLRCELTWVEKLADATALPDQDFDVALLDLNVPDSQGLDTVRQFRKFHPDLPIVILSGDANDETALKALREGAQDFIPKNEFNRSALERAIRFAIERQERELLGKVVQEHLMESAAARTVQERFMQRELPAIPGFELAGKCRPAEAVGGDFFDYIPWPGNRLGIVIGDVSGHGMPAALLMASTHTVIRTLKDYLPDPYALLEAANKQICEDTRSERFVELFVSVLDPETRQVTYVGAGHGGVLIRKDGEAINLPGTGLPAGVSIDLMMDEPGSFQMEPGDLLAIYTDGLYETRGDDNVILGQKAINSLIVKNRNAPLNELIETLMNAAFGFCGPEAPDDDITIALVRCVR
ncbi:MAG: fused response regulator/phosphatase [Planctomycetota bacterium]|nr:fused response regulator/phosphatase [Planctomycetota bacterium]